MRLTLLLCEGFCVTLAVMVTVVPMGVTDGAVYVAIPPSDVCAGDNVPHEPLLTLPVTGFPPQATTQFTPASMLSPEGIMLSCTVEATTSELT